MIEWGKLQELLGLLGLSLEDVPPFTPAPEGSGGLTRTPAGWVVEIPANLQEKEAIAFYLHNIAHYILKHHLRCPFKGDPTWDSACDYIANSFLINLLSKHFKNNPRIREIAAKLYPYRSEYDGMSAESLYVTLGGKVALFGDSHQNWENTGGIPLTPQEVKELIGQAERAGNKAANEKIYLQALRLKSLPPHIINSITQVFTLQAEEVLDILMLPYGRYWLLEMPQPKTTALHCIDISGSMRETLNSTFSTFLSVFVTIQSLGNCLRQKVLCIDVEKQFEWEGVEPDIALLRGLRELRGLGGTTFPNILLQELKGKELPVILAIYSDLMIHSDAMDSWEKIKREIVPSIPLCLIYNPLQKGHWEILVTPPKPQGGH